MNNLFHKKSIDLNPCFSLSENQSLVLTINKFRQIFDSKKNEELFVRVSNALGKPLGELCLKSDGTSGPNGSREYESFVSDSRSTANLGNLLPGTYFLDTSLTKANSSAGATARAKLVVAQQGWSRLSPLPVAVIGSCVTMGNFNSKLSPGWSDRFVLTGTHYQMSLISLFSPLVDIDVRKISDLDDHSRKWTIYDFNKRSLEKIKINPPEILIIDLRSDVKFPIIEHSGSFVTDNTWKLAKSRYYSDFIGSRRVSALHDFDEYIELFTAAVEKFNIFRRNNLKDTKIILNSSRSTGGYMKDGRFNAFDSENEVSLNVLWDQLEAAFLERVDAEVLNCWSEGILSDPDHPWGLGPVHYESTFYRRFAMKLQDILDGSRSLCLINLTG